jgi:opacity protein-like surface antigen
VPLNALLTHRAACCSGLGRSTAPVRTKIPPVMSMNRLVWAVATLAATCIAAPAFAADLNGPVYQRAAGPCYFRADVGYSWSGDPQTTFTQTDLGGVFITNAVGSDIDNGWLAGAGFGCGSGPRGIRGEVMFDWRADRDLQGVLAAPLGGTLHTSIQTSTIMFNAYYDLGHWGGFVPYVGAGVGVARNEMDGVAFSTSPNIQSGEDTWALAWSLMAGASFQLSERVILDFGYRFIDMGKAQSGTADSSGFTNNPPVHVDDLT